MGKIAQIQQILGVEADDDWGPKSQAALELLKHPAPAVQTPGTVSTAGYLMATEPGWDHIKARIDGDDIVIEQAIVTAFGGASDQMDNGETASGKVNTARQPHYIGCALPMRRQASEHLRGSPIPKLPWFTEVIFTDESKRATITTSLIDEGPAKWTKHAGDLTVAAAKFFDPKATANAADIPALTIRIRGGAKYVA